VRIGDPVLARVTISKLIAEKRFVTLKATCTIGETTVIEGEATVVVPSRD
jgi:3-hydroxybutyryl-CoA dehydratase